MNAHTHTHRNKKRQYLFHFFFLLLLVLLLETNYKHSQDFLLFFLLLYTWMCAMLVVGWRAGPEWGVGIAISSVRFTFIFRIWRCFINKYFRFRCDVFKQKRKIEIEQLRNHSAESTTCPANTHAMPRFHLFCFSLFFIDFGFKKRSNFNSNI